MSDILRGVAWLAVGLAVSATVVCALIVADGNYCWSAFAFTMMAVQSAPASCSSASCRVGFAIPKRDNRTTGTRFVFRARHFLCWLPRPLRFRSSRNAVSRSVTNSREGVWPPVAGVVLTLVHYVASIGPAHAMCIQNACGKWFRVT